MRKFKVKNKPKRKYIRKSNLPERDSLTRTAWYGFVPFFLVAIGLFSTTLITNPFITKAVSSIEIPHEITDSIVQPFQATAKTISNTRLPEVKTPQIDPSRLRQFVTDLGNNVTKFFLTSTMFLGNVFISGATQMIQATAKFLQWMGTVIVLTSRLVIQGVVWMASTIITLIGNALRILGNIVIAASQWIVRTIMSTGQAIIAASIAVANWFMSVITAIGNAISSFFTAVVNVVKIPFIALSKFYKLIEPGIIYVAKSFAESTNALLTSLAGILNATSQLTKK